jgi:hypothetical protein
LIYDKKWKNGSDNDRLKITNFLGFEEIGDEEKKEIKNIQREISKGIYVNFENIIEE